MKIYWLCSYPKSGNTWLRVFLNNYIFDRREPTSINEIGLGFAADSRHWVEDYGGMDSADLTWDELQRLRRAAILAKSATPGEPRLLKCHDAFTRLADGGEPAFPIAPEDAVIYLVRNPLDVAVSARSFFGIGSDAEVIRCLRGTPDPGDTLAGMWASRIPMELVSWSDHVRSWREALSLSDSIGSGHRFNPIESENPSAMLLKYEDLLADPETHFARVVETMGLDFDGDRLRRAIGFSRFEELAGQEERGTFKERGRGGARFFSGGIAGAWREKLAPETVGALIEDHGDTMGELGYLE